MIVLGLTDAAPSAAAIVIDGVVVAALDEAASPHAAVRGMPRRALTGVLDRAGVTARDIDRVMVAGIDRRPVNRLAPHAGGNRSGRGRIGALVPGLNLVLGPVFAHRRRMIRRVLDEEFAITAPVEFVHHHLAHAAGAYFTSAIADAIAVTLDDGGDGDRAHVYDIRKGHFRRIGGARITDAEPGDARSIADFVARHLGGNKPAEVVLAGAAFADGATGRLVGAVPGIERVFIAPAGAVCGLAPGAALAACMVNRKEARMAMAAAKPEPEMAPV
jgi:predicted NodU family carbamoyl transferase